MFKHIFGPINSRRFGRSLGVDPFPEKKVCNFDCLYCELKGSKPVDSTDDFTPAEVILHEVQESLKRFNDIDVVTITANGEPTLYPDLDKLCDGINAIKGNSKSLILSNGSTINDPKIQNILKKLDIVKLSLDCISKECFKKLDRHHKSIDIDSILRGMESFRAIYSGELVIEVLFVKGCNDNDDEIQKIANALQKIKPDRVDIGTIDRPPAYKVESIDSIKLNEIADVFGDEKIPIYIATRDDKSQKEALESEEIIDMLRRRPISETEATNLGIIEKIEELKEKGEICEKIYGNILFFTQNS